VPFKCGHYGDIYREKDGTVKCAVCQRYRTKRRYYVKQIPILEKEIIELNAESEFRLKLANQAYRQNDLVKSAELNRMALNLENEVQNLQFDLTQIADKIEQLELDFKA